MPESRMQRLRCFGVTQGGELDLEALFPNRCDAEFHVSRYGGTVVLLWGDVSIIGAGSSSFDDYKETVDG